MWFVCLHDAPVKTTKAQTGGPYVISAPVESPPDPEAKVQTTAPTPDLPPTQKADRRQTAALPAVGRPRRKARANGFDETVRWAAALGGRALTFAAVLFTVGCATVPLARPTAQRLPPPPSAMSQLDYPEDDLGHGGYRTISQAGCFLSSLAMASEALTEKQWDPKTANDHVKRAGGFSGAALEVPEAARALGLKVTWRGAVGADTLDTRYAAMRAHLEAGHAAVACVDLGPGRSSGVSEGDHFLFVYAAGEGGCFYAVDPLGGDAVKLTPDDEQGFLRYGPNGSRRVCELVFVEAR